MLFCYALIRQYVEPVVFCAQVASAFFDTGLQMVVKQRSQNSTSNSSTTDHQDHSQNIIANFYMIFNMLTKFVPIIPALVLARIGDRGYRKVPIVVPLVGYTVSRALLLFVILLDWRIEVMYAAPVIHGLCGGFSSYWAGVMASLNAIMRTELVYGMAGFLGSLASGHLFQLYSVDIKQGVVLASMSVVLYVFCLLYATFVLKVSRLAQDGLQRQDSTGIISNHFQQDKMIIALLFLSGILYDVAVGGGVEMLSIYVLKPPLAFLGVKLFTRFSVSDSSMVMIARSVMLFALIPMPTIRSLLSKQVRGTSYGKIVTLYYVKKMYQNKDIRTALNRRTETKQSNKSECLLC
uniref:Solute carrier family 46 member 2 n=1 Tax=Astyanax mexicanus TaxID=7994 RepID=A0A3B1IGE3_ASTMX